MNAAGIMLLITQMASLGLEFARLWERYSEVIGRAQAEGRDITAEELEMFAADRRAAVARWNDEVPPPAAGPSG